MNVQMVQTMGFKYRRNRELGLPKVPRIVDGEVVMQELPRKDLRRLIMSNRKRGKGWTR